mgnify:CR=1 FL=1
MSKIVIFGECMVELVNRGADTLSKGYAGDTYNTAVYLKRCAHDISVSYLTAIGADFLSDELLFKMGEEEINTDQVYRSNDRNLGLYMVRTDKHGERTFAYWRANSAATQTMNLFNGSLNNADVFYFSGISLAILDDAQRLKLFDLVDSVRAAGGKVVFDPNYRPRLWKDQQEAQTWIDKAYGQNHSILDNCHVRVTFATNDERTAKRISETLGTATELRAQRNYAGHRLAPWLGHLMGSRQETARPLLTPGEVMQLAPDESVVISEPIPVSTPTSIGVLQVVPKSVDRANLIWLPL